MTTPKKKPDDLKVFISSRDSKCDECGEELSPNAWITLRENKGALCLSCADLDHLAFLPSGDSALTRRSRKHSRLFAIVLKWSKRRKRYERQGILVENQAIERAEKECEADAETRKSRCASAALRRLELDQNYIKQFATRIKELFPNCPQGSEIIIAEHACRKYSGRVGRCAAAKDLKEKAVRLAVVAHIRHTETKYDELLLSGCNRDDARARIYNTVSLIIQKWES